MSRHQQDKDEHGMHDGPVTITDKRARHNTAPMTAEELLAQGDEENRKQQEAQALLAAQAKAESEQPDATSQYQGGGMQGESDAPPRESVVTAFVVLLRHDGTAIAGPLDLAYLASVDLQREVNASDMFKAAAEIQKDIAAGDTAQAVVNYMQQASAAMAAAQRGAGPRLPR